MKTDMNISFVKTINKMRHKIIKKEDFLKMVLEKIEQRKNEGKSIAFFIGVRISNDTANYVKKYINENTKHTMEIDKCFSCDNTRNVVIKIYG